MNRLQDRIADLAYQYTLEEVERTNRLTEEHRKALLGLVELMAGMATGGPEHRFAVGMPTGAGKTTTIRCLTRALHDLDAWNPRNVERADGILVAQSRVEQLCELKRYLVEHGVPQEMIGLVYSQRTAAERAVSEPTDIEIPHVEDRPIILVTQARVRGRRSDGVSQIERFSLFRREPRTMLYDEALVTTQALGIKIVDLGPGLGALKGCDEYQSQLQPAIAYVEEAIARIKAEVEQQKAGRSPIGNYITLRPTLDDETLDAWIRAIDRTRLRDKVDQVKELLGVSQDRLRVLSTGGGGVVQHRVLVPESMKKIIALDASYQVSRLVRLDPTLLDAEVKTGAFASVGKPLAELKDWSRVAVHHMRAPGGRESMQRAYKSRDSEKRWPSKEIAKVLRANPGRPTLIFNYKEKHGLSIEKRLRADLREHGIDLAQTVVVKDGDECIEVPMIRFATWGSHDASNEFRDVEVVIMNGVIQRDRVELAAAALGQAQGAKDAEQILCGESAVTELQQAEAASAVFQAGSRGRCRQVDGAMARGMDWYVIHYGRLLRKLLDPVMPGAKWVEWRAPAAVNANVQQASTKIVEALDLLEAQGRQSIASRDLKVLAGLRDLHRSTYSDAVTAALHRTRALWVRTGRTLNCFGDHPTAAAA
jgi:hypothetical protein